MMDERYITDTAKKAVDLLMRAIQAYTTGDKETAAKLASDAEPYFAEVKRFLNPPEPRHIGETELYIERLRNEKKDG